jgi:sugar-specific transcriptional regulator TrmB
MVDKNATSVTASSLGITENDFSVYSAFLKYGEISAAEIGRKIKMDKSSAYRATENLERLGLLIKDFKNRGTTYHAASPDLLKELFASKKTQLDILVDELKSQTMSSSRSTFMTVEKGIESLRFRMDESLDSKEKLIREKFNDRFRFFDDQDHVKYIINYAKERVKRGIKMVQLEEIDWTVDTRFKDVMVDTKKYLKEIKRLPKDAKLGENSLRIWDDTVNIISEDKNNDFIVITIKDKFVVNLMKNMFDFMWNRCEPI